MSGTFVRMGGLSISCKMMAREHTPIIAGQRDGDLWLAVSYPIAPLIGGKPPHEWGRALDFIPFVEVYTHDGGECCIVDIFADAETIRNPHRNVYSDSSMIESIVRMSDRMRAAWSTRLPRRHAEWARAQPLSWFINPEVGPLTLYRYQLDAGQEEPLMLQKGMGERRGGWTAHAVRWLEEAVSWVITSKGRQIRLQGGSLTNMGKLPFAEVAQYFIDKGETGFER